MASVDEMMQEEEWNDDEDEPEVLADDSNEYWDQDNPEDLAFLKKFEAFNTNWQDEPEEGELQHGTATAIDRPVAVAAPEEGEIATWSNSREQHKQADAAMDQPTPTGADPPRGQMNKSTIRVSRAGHQATARKRNRLERVAAAAGEAGEGEGSKPKQQQQKRMGITNTVCRALSERNWDLINSILRKLGRTIVIDVLSQTVDKERAGGMRTADDKRRRTPGGVFLKLLADRVGDKVLKPIFAENNKIKRAMIKKAMAKRRRV